MRLEADYLDDSERAQALEIAQQADDHEEQCESEEDDCTRRQSVIARGLRFAVDRSRFESVVNDGIGVLVRTLSRDPELSDDDRFVLTSLIERAEADARSEIRLIGRFNLRHHFQLRTQAPNYGRIAPPDEDPS